MKTNASHTNMSDSLARFSNHSFIATPMSIIRILIDDLCVLAHCS